MNKKVKSLLLIVVFIAILGGAYFAYTKLSEKFSPPPQTVVSSSGDKDLLKAMDFTVYDSEGNAVVLSDFFGKPIVLNFWASWCSPCKEEMPHFNTLYEEMGEDVQFLMVNMTDGKREKQADGEKYIADSKYTFPVYFDIDTDAAYVYNVQSIPTSIFIDKDGNIITAAQGSIDEETLRLGIDYITE